MRYSWASWVILPLAISRFPSAYLYRKCYIFVFFPLTRLHFWLEADLLQLKQPTQQFIICTEPTTSHEPEGGLMWSEAAHSVWRENTWLVNSHAGALALKGYRCRHGCHVPKSQLHLSTTSGKWWLFRWLLDDVLQIYAVVVVNIAKH